MDVQTVVVRLAENYVAIITFLTVVIGLYRAFHVRKQTKATVSEVKQSVEELAGSKFSYGDTLASVENVRLVEEYNSLVDRLTQPFRAKWMGVTEIDISWDGREFDEHFWQTHVMENPAIVEDTAVRISDVTKTGGAVKTRVRVNSLDLDEVYAEVEALVRTCESIADGIARTFPPGFHHESSEGNWDGAIERLTTNREASEEDQ